MEIAHRELRERELKPGEANSWRSRNARRKLQEGDWSCLAMLERQVGCGGWVP